MEYKDFAIDLAKQAGEIIRRNFAFGMEKQIKKDGSPVTVTDLAINKMVVEEVAKNFPGHSVVGEEQSAVVEDAEFSWVCDPVDGTIPFSHGVPTCAFSLALTQHGAPVLGVAYDPFMDRMFFAEKGKGSFVNGQRIYVSKKDKLEDCFVSATLFRNMKFPTPNIVGDMIFKRNIHYFAMQSVVYKGMLLAAGEIDGGFFPHETAHDIAAIKIIIEEAGGKVTDLFGNEQRYDRPIKGAVLSNGLIHEKLLEIVKENLEI